MSIKITSTTDSQETVISAMGDLVASEKVEDTKSAPSKEANGEISEESDTSISEDSEFLDTKDGEEDESESDESDAKDGDQKPKIKGGFKKRIHKLTSKLSAKESELEYWKQEALKRQSSETEKNPTLIQKKEADLKPKADDYDSHDEYIDALTDWKINQREKERETKSKADQLKTDHEKALASHHNRVEKFVETHEDFHELIEEVNDIPMPIVVQEVILASESGPELMYELAKNRKEYARICALPAVLAVHELGKFEARVIKQSESLEKKQEVKTTKAPPPIKAVGSKGVAVKKSIYDQNLSQREYEKLREEQERERYA